MEANAKVLQAGGFLPRPRGWALLDVPGASMFAKMRYLAEHRDDLRRRMLREPRGYPASCCNLILPPTVPEADAGFVIMEQTEYPPMSGSNTICVVTVLIETGMVAVEEPVTALTLETPAGLIQVRADVDGGLRCALASGALEGRCRLVSRTPAGRGPRQQSPELAVGGKHLQPQAVFLQPGEP